MCICVVLNIIDDVLKIVRESDERRIFKWKEKEKKKESELEVRKKREKKKKRELFLESIELVAELLYC